MQDTLRKITTTPESIQDIQKTDSITLQTLSKDSIVSVLNTKILPKSDTIVKVRKKAQDIQIKEIQITGIDSSLEIIKIEHTAKKSLAWNSAVDFNSFLYGDMESFRIENDTFLADSLSTSSLALQTKTQPFTHRITSTGDWIFWSFIILAFLFVWIQVFYKKYMVNLFNAVLSFQASSKLFEEKNLLARRVSLVLNFIYTISLSLIIFKITRYVGFEHDNFDDLSFFLLILNLIILYSIIKALLQKLIGFIFSRLHQINEYLHNIYVFNKSLGIIILPISFAAFYAQNYVTEILILVVIGLYVISLFFKIIRSFQIIIKHDIFIFYMILYLCTLEFLPVMIGYKFIKSLS